MAELGITPAEWRAMDLRDTTFLLAAKSEANRRVNNEQRRVQSQQRARRRLR